MGTVQSFEELRIWQDARLFVNDVYKDFGIGTAAERDFGFRDQIQRATLSIMNNHCRRIRACIG